MSGFASSDTLHAFEDDASLEQANLIFWSSLIGHIKADVYQPVRSILDIGCHHGGLLGKLAGVFNPLTLTGIEPSSHSRDRATFRLHNLAAEVTVISPERWGEVPSASMDLITCHEVLHLVEDLPTLFGNIARALSVNGTAFIVSGCHTENPLWRGWSAQLESYGQTFFDRSPFEILQAGIAAGLHGALRPLRRDGWVMYDPENADFRYSTAEELFDHQYRHKLLFRFLKRT